MFRVKHSTAGGLFLTNMPNLVQNVSRETFWTRFWPLYYDCVAK